MKYIYFDTETCAKVTDKLKAHVLSDICAAKNIKDPEKIKADIEKRKEKAIDDLGLHHGFAEIVVLCYAINDGPVITLDSRDYDNDGQMIEIFFNSIFETGEQWPRLCAFNAPFDVKGVYRRAMINGIKIPGFWPRVDLAPWKMAERVVDAMHGGWGDYAKQKDLAFAFDIPVEDEIDGSDVSHYWKHAPDLVLKHCKSDVAVLRELCKRMNLV